MTLEVGPKAQLPALLRTFERGAPDAIILDDLRDPAFISEDQEGLQATHNALTELGTTPGDEYAYHHYLIKAPIAVAINRGAKDREWLEPGKHGWLGNGRNRVVVGRGFSFGTGGGAIGI